MTNTSQPGRSFEGFCEHNVRVKKKKCKFMLTSVQYLGHRIDNQGIHVTDSKLAAVTLVPVTTNVQELRAFFGLMNYYGFHHVFSQIEQQLVQMTSYTLIHLSHQIAGCGGLNQVLFFC